MNVMCAMCMCVCTWMYCVPYVCVYTNAMCAMCMCTNAMVHVWGSEGGFQELVLSSHHVGLWGIKLKWLKLSGGAFTGRAISLAHNLFSRLLIYIAKGAKKKKRPWQSHKCALPSFRDRANPRSDEGHPALSQWPNIIAVIRQASTQGPRGVCDGWLTQPVGPCSLLSLPLVARRYLLPLRLALDC